MKRNAVLGAVLLAAALTTGCVDRKFVITSDPPNAAVYRNGEYIGNTPVVQSFVYYGTYEFKIVAAGHEPVVSRVPIKAPWYEIPPADLFTENLVPFWIRDHRPLHFTLPPKARESDENVLKRAEELRTRGMNIGAPRVENPAPPAVTPGLVVPSGPPTSLPPPSPPPVRDPLFGPP